MSAEQNRALLHRYIEEVWDKENPAVVDDFLAPTYRRHRSPATQPLTREQQKESLLNFRTAFKNIKILIEDVITEGDKIAFRSIMHGTHQGEYLGIAPTGRKVSFSLLDIIRVENGKFVEQWGGPDIYDLWQQLNAE